jgi:hypothetical protein
MEAFKNVNRIINLIKKGRELSSPKYYPLIYYKLIATLNTSGIELICVNSNYVIEDGTKVDFSFYYHPLKTIVLNFQTVRNKQLEPFWGKDFKLAYNLLLIHELGHHLAYNRNNFTEHGAWQHGLTLAEYLKIFTPELTLFFKNYFIA